MCASLESALGTAAGLLQKAGLFAFYARKELHMRPWVPLQCGWCVCAAPLQAIINVPMADVFLEMGRQEDAKPSAKVGRHGGLFLS